MCICKYSAMSCGHRLFAFVDVIHIPPFGQLTKYMILSLKRVASERKKEFQLNNVLQSITIDQYNFMSYISLRLVSQVYRFHLELSVPLNYHHYRL